MKIIECEQLSPEWFAIRAGVPGASNFDSILTTKGEPSKQQTKYLYRLAGERITGKKEETYQNSAMQRGIELEAEARSFYELATEVTVKQVGYCLNEEPRYGCSPDGLVGDDGLVEFKCPMMATHIGYMIKENLYTDYLQQVQGQLFVTGRKWCDLVSYYPGIKPIIIRVERNENFLIKLKVELQLFCEKLEDIVNKIK